MQVEEAEASWSARLVTKIVDNLQIHVSNVHIRYEDRVLHADDPFSFGLMIGRFAAESTDSTWKPSYVENQKILFKLCSLQGLSFYVNCAHGQQVKERGSAAGDSMLGENVRQKLAKMVDVYACASGKKAAGQVTRTESEKTAAPAAAKVGKMEGLESGDDLADPDSTQDAEHNTSCEWWAEPRFVESSTKVAFCA